MKRQEAKEQEQSREFSYYFDDDGMLVFKGRLLPEDGAVFIRAMQSMMTKLNEKTFPRERHCSNKSQDLRPLYND